MMKKIKVLLIILFCFANHMVYCQWVNKYKSGVINFISDRVFAFKTIWEDIIYNDNHDLAMTANGTIFMINSHENNFFMISSSGELLKKVSQLGEGPTDLYSPGSPCILDNKYLVIREFPESRRISIYNLSGTYVKKIRTRYEPFKIVTLKHNQIAYYSQKTLTPQHQSKQKVQHSIYIKDIQTEAEKLVEAIIIDSNIEPGSKFHISNFHYNVFLASTNDFQLLVGVSNRNRMDVFNEQGVKVKSFFLKLSPIPLTNDIIEKHEKYTKNQIAQELAQNQRATILPLLKKLSFKPFAGDTLPLFSNIKMDFDGNILVSKYPVDPENSKSTFQVYSREGTYLCESRFDFGPYKLAGKDILFTKDGIIGIFSTETEDDTIYKLMRMKASK